MIEVAHQENSLVPLTFLGIDANDDERGGESNQQFLCHNRTPLTLGIRDCYTGAAFLVFSRCPRDHSPRLFQPCALGIERHRVRCASVRR